MRLPPVRWEGLGAVYNIVLNVRLGGNICDALHSETLTKVRVHKICDDMKTSCAHRKLECGEGLVTKIVGVRGSQSLMDLQREGVGQTF